MLEKIQKFTVHHILSKNNILIVENLANLDKQSKNQKFQTNCITIEIKEYATGSPVRAMWEFKIQVNEIIFFCNWLDKFLIIEILFSTKLH